MSLFKPNKILAEPATPEACAGDLRSKGERLVQAGEARSQFADARQTASTGAKAAGRAADRRGRS